MKTVEIKALMTAKNSLHYFQALADVYTVKEQLIVDQSRKPKYHKNYVVTGLGSEYRENEEDYELHADQGLWMQRVYVKELR